MAEHSSIEWTDATWNPITGCSIVSPGCTNCYAMKLAGGRLQHHPSRAGLTRPSRGGPVWTGEVRLNEDWIEQPLRWKKPRRIFVCAHGDLFAEQVPDEWIDRIFAVMAVAPQHTFQVLTKRAERMREYLQSDRQLRWLAIMRGKWSNRLACEVSEDGSLPNVWLGVSAEDQDRANQRVPALVDTPAAVRFVSAEPLLGPVELSDWDLDDFIHWVIVGGESGPGARPMHPDWARSLRDQCQAAGVAFHFKQWGNFAPRYDGVGREHPTEVGKKAAGRVLDGRTWDEVPE